MDKDSKIVTVELDATFHNSGDSRYGELLDVEIRNPEIPSRVSQWLEQWAEKGYHFKEDSMQNSTWVTLEFEVLVDFREVNGRNTATSATLQYEDMPKFVSGWLELKAMEQFNQSQEGGNHGH